MPCSRRLSEFRHDPVSPVLVWHPDGPFSNPYVAEDALYYEVAASVLGRNRLRHFIVSPAVELTTSNVFPNAAPLFEEKRNVLLSTCAKDFADPFDLHRSRSRTRLSADDYLVKSC